MSRARQVLSVPDAQASAASMSYNVWVYDDQIELVRTAMNSYEGGCAAWVANAVTRFLRETDLEIDSLIGGLRGEDREGKTNLSFRMYRTDQEKAKEIAKKYSSSIQATMAAMFFMHAIAPSAVLRTDCEEDGEIEGEDAFELNPETE